jgi:hypothetical protein
MLRRRSRRPKPGTSRSPRAAAPVAPAQRRRARPGAVIPKEVLLPPRQAAPDPARGGEVVLVTGFEPFGGEPTNPSWEICTRLSNAIGNARIETLRVPCA